MPHKLPEAVRILLVIDAFEYATILLYHSKAMDIVFSELFIMEIKLYKVMTFSKVVAAMFTIYGGWMADSYFDKYVLYLMSVALVSLVYVPLMIAIMMAPLFQQYATKIQFLSGSDIIYSSLIFGNVMRKPLIAEQFPRPEMLSTYRRYLFYEFWLQNLGVIMIFAVLSVATHETNCYSITCNGIPYFISIIINLIYLGVFLSISKRLYIKKKYPHIVEKMIYCIFLALKTKRELKHYVHPSETKRNWVDYALGWCHVEVIENTKDFCKILLIIISCAVYWSFRENVNTCWVYQANVMNVQVHYFMMYPLSVNAILATLNIVLLPIAYFFLYPISETVRSLNTPLKSFGLSYFFIGCAFICSGFINIIVERNESGSQYRGLGQFKIYNGQPYPIFIRCPWLSGQITLGAYEMLAKSDIKTVGGLTSVSTIIHNDEKKYFWNGILTVYDHQSVSYIATNDGVILTDGFDNIHRVHILRPKVIVYCANQCGSGNVTYTNMKTLAKFSAEIPRRTRKKATIEMLGLGTYKLDIDGEEQTKQEILSGEVFSLLLYTSENGLLNYKIFLLVKRNEVTVLTLIPQYIFLSLSDIFGYVPYNIVLYSLAPPHLRSFCFCLNEMFKMIGDQLLITADYYLPMRHSSLMFHRSLFIFTFVLLYLYLVIKLKFEIKHTEELLE